MTVGNTVRFVVVGAVVLLLAGCSGGGVDLGVTTWASPSSEVPVSPVDVEEDENGAPRVEDPLQVNGIVDEPCGALAADQLRALGFSPGELNTFGDDDGCDWRLANSTLGTVTVRPLVSENGLGDVYGRQDYSEYFEPTTVNGYPAVYESVLDERNDGGCTLYVGVTDELAVEVDTTFLDVEPCPVAEETAEAVITRLQDN